MIIKQPPSFIPIQKHQDHSSPVKNDPQPQGPNADGFAQIVNQSIQMGAGTVDIPTLPGTLLPTIPPQPFMDSEKSDISSILTSIMQLASMPIAATVAATEPTGQENGIRRAISAYAPHYSTEGFRQKIDFGARASFPNVVNNLAATISGSSPDSTTRNKNVSEFQVHGTEASRNASSVMKPVQGGQSTLSPDSMPGFLAARFESQGQPEAIGYDRRGGTCYGIYQLSSRMGTMDAFIKFLDKKAPEWAERLRESGPANTRSRSGAMPREWQSISRENPDKFARLQHEFVLNNYYKPAARAVQRRIGLDPDGISTAMREVIWSTAVQHGVTGAANIFERAASKLDQRNESTQGSRIMEKDLIQSVYAERGKRFTGSTPTVRSSVKERFAEEMQLALALLPKTMDRHV